MKIKILVLFMLFFLGCSNKKEVKPEISKSVYEDIVWKDYHRIIGLLSIKYNVDRPVVERMVIYYLGINFPFEYNTLMLKRKDRDTSVVFNSIKPIENINNVVFNLSEYFKLDRQLVANILFDFELWYNIRAAKK